MKWAKYTSAELSNDLKDAGAKQDSAQGRSTGFYGVHPAYLLGETLRPKGYVSAFDCHELWEQLPQTIIVDSVMYGLTLKKVSGGCEAKYMRGDGQMAIGIQLARYSTEVLGKLYLWCLTRTPLMRPDCDEEDDYNILLYK